MSMDEEKKGLTREAKSEGDVTGWPLEDGKMEKGREPW